MINRLLSLAARCGFQPLWRAIFNIALGGLGHVNAVAALNGENRYLADWSAQQRTLDVPLVIFDIGANEGDFTAEVLKHLSEVTIHCFEPGPDTFSRMHARFDGDERITANHCGLGDETGTLTLYDYSGSSGSEHASFLAETFTGIYPSETKKVDVPITTVDAYLRDKAISRVDFLKLDVEGFEKKVFAGMTEAINARRIAIIQFEFNAHNAVTGLSLYRISQLLYGYDIFKILPNGLDPVISKERPYNARVEIFKYANYVAILRP